MFCRLLFRRREFFDDVAGRAFFHFTMSRHGVHLPGDDIPVPIMALAMPDEDASLVRDDSNDVADFHAKASSATLRRLSCIVPSAIISRMSSRRDMSISLSSSKVMANKRPPQKRV